MTKLYPKSTIRRTIKAHEPHHKLSKTADVLVRLQYLQFLISGLFRFRVIHEGPHEGV
jgi:hypothetical protein